MIRQTLSLMLSSFAPPGLIFNESQTSSRGYAAKAAAGLARCRFAAATERHFT